MKPGRELDALVAENVMGRDMRMYTQPCSKPDCPYLTGIHYHGPDMSSDGPPHYSTDIAAAWAVVEKLDMLNSECALFRYQRFNQNPDKAWKIAERVGGWEFCDFAEGESPAHVICVAALKIVGFEINAKT